ncbi:MAG TPA: bifunctional pyr operon transcriptional regulator/uracil phosphoribosyltransferase PyrR [Candidatus Binataceae bacterium]|jgi:pyrimidine operon attenuation protein/uracil phosphoribosyltransferase
MTPEVVLDAAAISRSVRRLAHEIVEHDGVANLVLLGVVRRGAILATRLAGVIEQISGQSVARGTLDISLYRDDGEADANHRDPRLLGRDVPGQLDGLRVVLVDDVLYTGRTIRAAFDAISDLGRPESIELAVLIDRGHRELPIRADYVGKTVNSPHGTRVYVRLIEVDGADCVVLGGPKSESRRPTQAR